jgi:predicted MFS family arabinose efflux permease
MATAKLLKRTFVSITPISQSEGQWPLLLTLAAIQLAHVLDFVLIMPLGPMLMRELAISPKAFSLLVSAYNIAAAIAGLGASSFIDRFDRRDSLLVVSFGFAIGTLACALPPATVGPLRYDLLLAARTLTGVFGGLLQAVIFTIIGDSFSESRRGAATGTVMSAFSISSIFGIPIGLFLASRFDWRAPFLMLALFAFGLTIMASRTIPSLKSHLSDSNRIQAQHLRSLLFERNSLYAFAMIVFLMFAGFTIVPFIGAYLVNNIGLSERDLASVFLVSGLATLLTARTTGIVADRFGKASVFSWLAALSILPILALTNVSHLSVMMAIVVTALVTMLISARAIPALAMITSSIDRARRGRFLSLTSSVQQAASGIASFVAGSVLGTGSRGELTHYGWAGVISAVATGLAIAAAHKLTPLSEERR